MVTARHWKFAPDDSREKKIWSKLILFYFVFPIWVTSLFDLRPSLSGNFGLRL